MNSKAKDKVKVQAWIQQILEKDIVQPDDLQILKINLLEGILEDDVNKIKKAESELSRKHIKILQEKLKELNSALEKTEKFNIEDSIDNFLLTQGKKSNSELRDLMIRCLKTGQ